MKNKLKAELKDLATKILQNEGEVSTKELKEEAKNLYEKLTVFAFTEENLAALTAETPGKKEEVKPQVTQVKKEKPTHQPTPVVEMKPNPVPVQEEEKDEYLPDGTEYNETQLIEPNTEKIKDIVAQMPPETEKMDHMVNNIIAQRSTPPVQQTRQKEKEDDFRKIGVDYDNLPNFEPVRKQEKERPKSLNDRLKKGFNIGLNERMAFIRHLFEGKTSDYNRVISQLNTFDSEAEAKRFIQLVVKPDYKNWQGKEEFENKFMELVENKFSN